MHTVCETRSFQSAAAQCGLDRADIDRFVGIVAVDPLIGDLMEGTGGCRKVRFGGRRKGKSGGYRIITFFTGEHLPLFLITVFGKGEQANLTKAERNNLSTISKTIATDYRNQVVKAGAPQ